MDIDSLLCTPSPVLEDTTLTMPASNLRKRSFPTPSSPFNADDTKKRRLLSSTYTFSPPTFILQAFPPKSNATEIQPPTFLPLMAPAKDLNLIPLPEGTLPFNTLLLTDAPIDIPDILHVPTTAIEWPPIAVVDLPHAWRHESAWVPYLPPKSEQAFGRVAKCWEHFLQSLTGQPSPMLLNNSEPSDSVETLLNFIKTAWEPLEELLQIGLLGQDEGHEGVKNWVMERQNRLGTYGKTLTKDIITKYYFLVHYLEAYTLATGFFGPPISVTSSLLESTEPNTHAFLTPFQVALARFLASHERTHYTNLSVRTSFSPTMPLPSPATYKSLGIKPPTNRWRAGYTISSAVYWLRECKSSILLSSNFWRFTLPPGATNAVRRELALAIAHGSTLVHHLFNSEITAPILHTDKQHVAIFRSAVLARWHVKEVWLQFEQAGDLVFANIARVGEDGKKGSTEWRKAQLSSNVEKLLAVCECVIWDSVQAGFSDPESII